MEINFIEANKILRSEILKSQEIGYLTIDAIAILNKMILVYITGQLIEEEHPEEDEIAKLVYNKLDACTFVLLDISKYFTKYDDNKLGTPQKCFNYFYQLIRMGFSKYVIRTKIPKDKQGRRKRIIKDTLISDLVR